MITPIVLIFLFIVFWRQVIDKSKTRFGDEWYEKGRFWLFLLLFVPVSVGASWALGLVFYPEDKYILDSTENHSLSYHLESYRKYSEEEAEKGKHLVEKLINKKGEVYYRFHRYDVYGPEEIETSAEDIELIYDENYEPHLEVQSYSRPQNVWWLFIADYTSKYVLYCDSNTVIIEDNKLILEN